MRVLIDAAAFGRGGAERQTSQLAAGLVARGHECALVVNKSVCAYQDELHSGHVPARVLGRDNRYDVRLLADLVRAVRGYGPNVLVSVGFSATFWGRLAAQILHVPNITVEHSTLSRIPWKLSAANRMLAHRTSATVACARAQVSSLVAAGNLPDRLVVIHNGVDTSAFYRNREEGQRFRQRVGLPQDAMVVGLVAAHRQEKRHDRFLHLVEGLVSRQTDNVWGCMVGGGPLFERNAAAALRSPAAHRLSVVPAQIHMRAVYSALDVVVLVSDSETFPMSLLEAQACGCAVAGLDAGGVRSTFDRGRSGLLAAEGDTGSLVGELDALLKSPKRVRAMGEHGRCWVENHMSNERMIDQYERLLEQVAGA